MTILYYLIRWPINGSWPNQKLSSTESLIIAGYSKLCTDIAMDSAITIIVGNHRWLCIILQKKMKRVIYVHLCTKHYTTLIDGTLYYITRIDDKSAEPSIYIYLYWRPLMHPVYHVANHTFYEWLFRLILCNILLNFAMATHIQVIYRSIWNEHHFSF